MDDGSGTTLAVATADGGAMTLYERSDMLAIRGLVGRTDRTATESVESAVRKGGLEQPAQVRRLPYILTKTFYVSVRCPALHEPFGKSTRADGEGPSTVLIRACFSVRCNREDTAPSIPKSWAAAAPLAQMPSYTLSSRAHSTAVLDTQTMVCTMHHRARH